ncbi:OmpA family protein [Argonema antarcticum]|nr:OmpA family protein [Argonema antarcticum]
MRETNVKEYSDESTGFGRFLLVLLFRLLLLGVGGVIAALLGVAIATVRPATTPNKPLVAKLLQLPGDMKNPPTTPNNPTSTEQTSPESEAAAVRTAPKLTAQQRQKLQAELNQLQAQLKSLRSSTAALENRVGSSASTEPLETRIQVLTQQLKATPQPQQTGDTAAAAEVDRVPSTTPTSLISPDTLTATLPSDALFQDSDATLRPEARLILDKLVAELQNYPTATIRIAAHTDGAGEAKNNRVLSFRQAQAVEQYLSRLKNRLFVVGYGETRPLAPNDTKINLQRNRRVEIFVESQ